jgi:leucyl-tRNA synthetase
MPVWIANYVLMDYGTGAIMAVPAHDQRDYEFAQKYGLRTKPVIIPEEGSAEKAEEGKAFESYGRLQDSGPFSGLLCTEAIDKMGAYAEEKNIGRRSTTFRLRDWGISRQRYWGTPIPIITCAKCGTVGVPYEDLPVEIPLEAAITGEEGSPLERLESFVHTVCPRCGGKARRETDTMDTFVDSSWYFFRYTSPREEKLPFRPEAANYWLPVDLYIGGVEHAILHLIYARFFTKVLRDLGLTEVSEPFPHYLAQGMVTKDGSAMSKSKGNTVDPDEILKKFGADALRLFIIFASPPDREFAWAEEGLEGSHRFLGRVWTIVHENLDIFPGGASRPFNDHPAGEGVDRVLRKTHQTIKKVGEDIEVRFHLNTAVSSIMELYNLVRKDRDALRQSSEGKAALRSALEALVQLLSPFSPHIAEELWEKMGHSEMLIRTPWPVFDPALTREETVTIVVQVNGKIRDKFEAVRDLAEKDLEEEALRLPKVRAALGGKSARKVICVKNKLVSIVV